MEILVTNITLNQRGQAQREQRRISGAVFNLGRGTQCEVHLPDPRLALIHARLTVTETSAAVEVESGRFAVNGRDVDRAELSIGDRVEIGPYLIEVESPPAGIRLALSIQLTSTFGKTGGGGRRRLRVRAPQLSMRRLSYLGFFSVLVLFLVVPVLPEVLKRSELQVPDEKLQLGGEILRALGAAFTQSWNPGPLSRSHQVFGKECGACHVNPFIQVRDRECIACHNKIHEHVPRSKLSGLRGVVLRETRCAECHRDHKDAPLMPRAQDACAECHRDIKSASPRAVSGNVTDFGRDHPPFRLSVPDASRAEGVRRVRQGAIPPGKLTEKSNLKFNHKLHLDPGGVRDPQGKRDVAGMRDSLGRRTVLTCENCHEPEAAGRLMAPVAMERHCQSCHSLAFEPEVSARQVPHGSEEGVVTMLREFYARLALGDTPPGASPPRGVPRMRPGAELSHEDRQRVLRIADRKAQQVLRDLFDRRQVCSTCHYVARRSGGAGWEVAPVVLAQQWMPAATFTHAKHASHACATCHNVTTSTVAEDVAMPDIAKCRECHVGARPAHNRVASDCATCHKFHSGSGYWHETMQIQMLPRALQ